MSEHILKLPDSGPTSSDLISKIDAFIVRDSFTYETMGHLLKTVKSMMVDIDRDFDPSIEQAHKLHKMALGLKAKFYGPLQRIEIVAKEKLVAYDKLVLEAQRKAKAAERKTKAEQEATEARLKEEAIELKRQAEMALELAFEAEQEGSQEVSDELLAEAARLERLPIRMQIPVVEVAPPAPSPLPSPPHVEGISSRRVWFWKVSDLSKVPKAYFELNVSLLNSIARRQKDRAEVPGIDFYSEPAISARKVW